MQDFRMETFLSVCEYMNFTKAAKELNITQPAVSQHIRFLEEYYQQKLFHYEGKKLYLTKAGKILRSTALTMLHDEIALKKQMEQSEEEVKSIRFGATMTIGEFVMIDILKRYLKADERVQIYMEYANTQELLSSLEEGKIDFAFVEGFFQKSEYDFLQYSAEEYIAVCSPEYQFSGRDEPEKLEELLGERLILREPGSGTREVLERYLSFRNLSVEDFVQTAEIGSIHTIKELVKAGCGVTFLYEVAVQDELEKNELKKINLKDFHLSHDFTFIWRRGSLYEDTYKELFQQLVPGE